MRRGGDVNKRAKQMFGGQWTQEKLARVEAYLQDYVTALKKQLHLRKTFIDAFAGTGYSQIKRKDNRTKALFPELLTLESAEFIEGSAKRALRTNPPFDRYMLIELSPTKCKELEKLKQEFVPLAGRIEIMNEEANAVLRRLCSAWDSSDRAVVFLDPCGMQVEWSTIESLASTQSVDLWILFPLGSGPNRLLARDITRITEAWRNRLTLFFGTTEWEHHFYSVTESETLFGQDTKTEKVADLDTIGRYFRSRLSSVFPFVVGPGTLHGANGSPLFLLAFAAANPGRGGEIASRIAGHLLKDL
jgi:three-Cys-motif partner protein